jgi:hypothetical protein
LASSHVCRRTCFALIFSDDLAGTDVYGTYVANDRADATFSVPFGALLTPDTEMLFIAGDRSQSLVTTFRSVILGQINAVLNVSFSTGPAGLLLDSVFNLPAQGHLHSLPRQLRVIRSWEILCPLQQELYMVFV